MCSVTQKDDSIDSNWIYLKCYKFAGGTVLPIFEETFLSNDLKEFGKVSIPQEAFIEILKTDND
jgi:hypothetical protein